MSSPETERAVPPEPQPRKRRPKRLRARRPPLTIELILAWIDAHHARTGTWPKKDSGSVTDTIGETWCGINLALRNGGRGLPGGSSLAQLLADRRGVRNIQMLPPLNEAMILQWADAHHRRTGEWPTLHSCPVTDASDETWYNVDAALREGRRGLPGGGSLARLLARHRGVRNRRGLPPLTVAQVLRWADAFHARTGRWPTADDGDIPEAAGESWSAVDAALHNGCRGFPGGSSLAKVLAEHRGVRNRKDLPPLTPEGILAWADAFLAEHGHWPNEKSGEVAGSGGETWAGINAALREGLRGLQGGTTLFRLLVENGRGPGSENGSP